MGAVALLVLLRPARFLLVSQEAVHVPRETVLQPAKVLLAVAQEMARGVLVRLRRLEQPVLADVAVGVLFVEDEVPVASQRAQRDATALLTTAE